jgi:uncharacterized protein YdeI (YjbR/CyaY-like superfamily)
MEIGEIFYPRTRAAWRAWLEANHQSKSVIWLRRFKKDTGKASISYDDLVEECLCFGWIDGTIKKLDTESNVQRITPRRAKSYLSELNRQRVWKLQRRGLMTPAGLAALGDKVGSPEDPWEMPEWIAQQLQADDELWRKVEELPYFYKRLKLGWIDEPGRRRQEERQKRLDYFVRMTHAGKRYGTQPLES